MKQYAEVGRLGKTHGYNGEIKLHCEDQFLEAILQAPALFVKVQNQFVPLFLEGVRGQGLDIVKFEDYDNKEALKPFTNQPVYLPDSAVSNIKTSTTDFAYLTSYEVWVEVNAESIGTIRDIEEYPAHEVAIVQLNSGKEAMIPLVDEFINKIDEVKRQIHFSLPDGLLDL